MDSRSRIIHEAAIAIAVVGGILALVTALAWNWPPVVVVESGSMMHVEKAFEGGRLVETREEGVLYGRLGTIDPGDLVLVRAVGERGDVEVLADQGTERYGAPGDVIVYYASNIRGEAVPKIHRALAWIEVSGEFGNRSYRGHLPGGGDCGPGGTRDGEWCAYDSAGVPMGPYAYRCGGSCSTRYTFSHSGYLTQGDNNPEPDQVIGISRELVAVSWIEGKARAEIPWIGLVKLAFSPTLNQPNHPEGWTQYQNAVAPSDLWASLFVTLGVLVVGPIAWDMARATYEKRRGIAVASESPSYGIAFAERAVILVFGTSVGIMALYNAATIRVGGLHPAWAVLFTPLGAMAAYIGYHGVRGVLAARADGAEPPPIVPVAGRLRVAALGVWGGIFLAFAAANFAFTDTSNPATLGETIGMIFIALGLGLIGGAYFLHRHEEKAGTL